MRKLLLFLLLSASVFAQPIQTFTARHIRYGASLPATCNPATGDVFYKTSATIATYYCSAANTWTVIGVGAGGPPTGAAGGSLDGTYPNPTIANLPTVNAIPYVDSAGVLTQDSPNLQYAGTILYAPYMQVATSYRIGGNSVLHTRGGTSNVFFGVGAGNFTLTGTENVAGGSTALTALTTGTFNIAIGSQALNKCTICDYNTAIGGQALYNNLDGASSVAIGHTALYASTQSTSNVAIGQGALYSLTNASGGHNLGVGVQAGYDASTGTANIFLGTNSGRGFNLTGSGRFIAGSYSQPITDVYFGSGEGTGDASAPAGYILHGSGANSLDAAGANITVAAGRGTGTGASGAIIFQYAPAGASGSTQNALAEAGRITSGGVFQMALYATATNCASGASPAVCGAASSGAVALPAGGTTLTVNTTAVNAVSRILITENTTVGTELSVTCNTTVVRTYAVTTITAGTSFVITTSGAPVTDPACLSFMIVN